MLFKNIALITLAAVAVAAPAQDSSEAPQDIHKFKEEMHKKKCPQPSCKKSIVSTSTQYFSATMTVTKIIPKKCAPTKETKEQRCPSCGNSDCGGC